MPLECSGCHKRCARTSDLTKHEKRCDVLVMRNRKYDEFRRKTASNKRRHSSPSSERSRSSSRKRSRRERTPVDEAGGSYICNNTSLENERPRDNSAEFCSQSGVDCNEPQILEPPQPAVAQELASAPAPALPPQSTVPPALLSANLPSTAPVPESLGRGLRIKRLPAKLREDILPEGPAPFPPEEQLHSMIEPDPDPEPSTVTRRFLQLGTNIRLILVNKFKTMANTFRVSRLYYGKPDRIPDEFISPADVVVDNVASMSSSHRRRGILEAIWPYPNLSTWRLGSWFWSSGDTKSRSGFKDLVDNVLLAEDFNIDDIRGVNWDNLNDLLAKSAPDAPEGENWRESAVDIEVPTGIKKKASDRGHNLSSRASRVFTVHGLWTRSIPQVIKSVFSGDTSTESFHFNPFKQFWQNTQGKLERVRDELFNSDAWLRAHEEIEALPRVEGDMLPRCIAALMFWSDATHLAQFGQAKLWPIYLFFGNQSKWIRCKPSAHACHHVGYLPTIPDSIMEFIRLHVGSGTASSLKTHCRRELFHAALKVLLDEEFMHAWKYGIIIDCLDGITRRVFPRIFTWSADYPEKVLLASIRDLGTCPCPKCLVRKDDIPKLGMRSDCTTRERKSRKDDEERRWNVERARKAIYQDGFVVDSDTVNYFLKPDSLVPTEVLFTEGFNFFNMLTVDLMHEIELGVWKAIFTHLVRMLYSLGPTMVDQLNARYREIPTFGRSTIRRFAADVSEMKKLAARDFEDILQCAIPVFEGLFPEKWDMRIQQLLFTLAQWHALAKLRVQTESTIYNLELLTTHLGEALRHFSDLICPNFETIDTPGEARARARALTRKKAASASTSLAAVKSTGKVVSDRPRRYFNLNTYKLHAMGHYACDIREFGTTDSYSTQIGELEHRSSKSRYRNRTNKNKFTHQLARLIQRAENIRRSAQKLKAYKVKVPAHQVGSGGTLTECREPVSADEQYHIARDQRNPLYLGQWLHQHPDDPALKGFIPRLKDHLLSRLRGQGGAGEEAIFSEKERDALFFQHERIYAHAILRINFTTYDMRRDQDFINPRTGKRFIMVNSNEDSPEARKFHPFWYAQVLGIFHANVFLSVGSSTAKPIRMEFLWVRWFGHDSMWKSGWQARHLDRIGFVPQEDTEAFGFLDPGAVIRAAHLIPVFAYGRTIELCAPSVAREDEGDWEYYYVNRFVDRDMFMRYMGGGIGHLPSVEDEEWEDEIAGETEDVVTDGVEELRLGHEELEGEYESSDSDSKSDDGDTEEAEEALQEVESSEEFEGEEEFEY